MSNEFEHQNLTPKDIVTKTYKPLEQPRTPVNGNYQPVGQQTPGSGSGSGSSQPPQGGSGVPKK